MQNGAHLDEINQKLLTYLREDGRISIAELSRQLGLSRSAVQDRMKRLEDLGVIEGYTVLTSLPKTDTSVQAILSVKIGQRPCAPVLLKLRQIEGLQGLYSTAGPRDAVMIVQAHNTNALTKLIDQISDIEHVTDVEATVVLASYV